MQSPSSPTPIETDSITKDDTVFILKKLTNTFQIITELISSNNYIMDQLNSEVDQNSELRKINAELITSNNRIVELLQTEIEQNLQLQNDMEKFKKVAIYLTNQNNIFTKDIDRLEDQIDNANKLHAQQMKVNFDLSENNNFFKQQIQYFDDRMRTMEEVQQNDFRTISEYQQWTEEADQQLQNDFSDIRDIRDQMSEMHFKIENDADRINQLEDHVNTLETYCQNDYFYLVRGGRP